jgi:predicted PurR-regulated permease PerM
LARITSAKYVDYLPYGTIFQISQLVFLKLVNFCFMGVTAGGVPAYLLNPLHIRLRTVRLRQHRVGSNAVCGWRNAIDA